MVVGGDDCTTRTVLLREQQQRSSSLTLKNRSKDPSPRKQLSENREYCETYSLAAETVHEATFPMDI